MAFWSRLRAFGHRIRRRALWERSLHDELQSYLEHEVDARSAAGMPAREARRTALADFGGLQQVTEKMRSGATGAWVDTAVQDLRYSCRALWGSRGFTAGVAGSLAIGMAAAIAAFAFLLTLLVGPFPGVTQQNRLVRISASRNCGSPDCWRRMSSPADLTELREGLAGITGLAGYTFAQVAVGVPEARSFRGVVTSGNYFEVLGVRPAVGRMFDAGDDDRHAAVAVIAHRVWIRDFGGDPSVIGRPMLVGGERVEIAGVAPEFFVGVDLRAARGDRGPEIWLPMWLAHRVLPRTSAGTRQPDGDLSFVGRLRDGVTVRQLQAEAEVIAGRRSGVGGPASHPSVARVRRVWVTNPEHWSLTVSLLLPVPCLVLVIACLNAANLTLARGSGRRRELAIRLAIGAGRGRVIRQLLTESGLLVALATGTALPVAWAGLQLARGPVSIPIALDATVLALTVATAAATTIAFGLLPAVRLSAQQPSSTLRSAGARIDSLPQQSRMRRGLVMVQVALSLGLLASGSQLIATVRSQAVSAGTPANQLLIARFDLESREVAAGESERFYEALLRGARRLQGVESAGLARHTSVWTFGQRAGSGSVSIWLPGDDPKHGRMITGGYAGGDLFQAVGLTTLAGRGFTSSDRLPRPQVAVVNRTLATEMSGPVVGRVVRVAPRGQDFHSSIEVQVVGVIESALEPRLAHGQPPASTLYLPSPIEPEPALALYLRTRGLASTAAQPLRELVSDISPRVPILEIGSLADFNERSFAPQLWLARAAACLGVVGLLLATAGVYGVSAYTAAMQSRELAIRMAVGASPRAILSMVLGQSLRLMLLGLLAGGGIALVVSRVIQSEYHGIVAIDGFAFGGAVSLFLGAMLLASAIPALRASRVNLVEMLREA